MQERFECTERFRHHVGRWWHEARRVERAASGTNPVLARAQLAWLQLAAARAMHELGMNLADKSHTHGQFGQPFQSVVHRAHIVDDLIHIARQMLTRHQRLSGKQILQRTLRALDLAREHRLLAHVHVNEEIGIGQGEHRAVEPPECAISAREQRHQLAGKINCRVRRQRARHKRAVASQLTDIVTSSRRRFIRCRHAFISLAYGKEISPYNSQPLTWAQEPRHM